ncbi:hypothetical protein BVRB_2g023630 isoform B [Beta vulgaris subsp. vulgaris]|uniref:uncharacterized protein LOC104903240 isoform X2 n=1 Tax=Beta vulgaris subsp. vulgaris TaxID=3555 RepID=UPI00053FE93B|nr:uncharacterized protein LOC104903240 isoform X2 [Beta vulgaris subsp. vulgaris]KMT18191.1 hypothetical protein BVRB_2g023630 isoform B [Beta vulgaris subsp. vulgaris]
MLAKLFNKQSQSDSQNNKGLIDLDPQVIAHYGIPSTASCLAYDPIQQLLAIGTLDGRIKIIGSDNIEGLLTSPKEIPFKNLEFLHNQGLLVAVSNENDIQVWDLEHRFIASLFQWESNITAFSVIQETNYMYLGDDCGLVSVVKYDIEDRKIMRQQYSITAHSVFEVAEIPLRNDPSVVGILPQPCSGGNRLLFAYDNGVIVLWDIAKDQLVYVRGRNNHPVNDGHLNTSAIRSNEIKDQVLCGEQGDKEIISVCWASSDGSILAVGYVDGDILLWKLSDVAMGNDHKPGNPANNMVKIQLSSAEKRFPVIVLHWSARGVHDDYGGQLFIYGGDEMGSAEVLTMLSFDWSPTRDALKNVVRTNVTLQGSFADMILLQDYSVLDDTRTTSLFLLTSPGQLQYYDNSCLLGLHSGSDKSCTIPLHYRSVVPTAEPYLTVGRFIAILNTKCSAALSELQETYLPSDKSTKWPLNGGVPCHLSLHGERKVERLYIAGYQDGTVRIWDATYPILSPIFVLDPEVRGITKAGAKGSVSALDFSSETLYIAIGNDCGTVHLHNLTNNCNETKLHVVSGTKSEVCDFNPESGSHFSAVFTLSTSPVCTLRYTSLGARLAVGYMSGQVAMLNLSSLSVLYVLDTLSSPNSHVVSISPAISLETYGLAASSDHSVPHGKTESGKELIFALTSNLHIAVLDTSNGNVIGSVSKQHNESTAISMYILEGNKCITEVSGGKSQRFWSQENKEKAEPAQVSGYSEGKSDGVDQSTDFVQSSTDLLILLCCTDALLLCSLNSVIQGHVESICEVHLLKTSCWTTTFKTDEEEHRLLVFYQTGSIEIRSLPNLEVLGEVSLLSIMRWNFRTNMDKTLSCTERGQISLVNGCEFVVLSLLASENDYRVPQSLPCLYDEALAAALDLSLSPDQKKNKETSPGFFGGIMKGLRASQEAQSRDPMGGPKSLLSALDKVFSSPKTEASAVPKDVGKAVDLNIDDIEIDGPLHVSPIAHKGEVGKDKSQERKKLFEGGTSETKPKQRTIEEIKAKYRKAEDTSSATASAASAASEAKNKLLERQEKLERIDQNSEELRNNAENFSSMAKELAKRMESRKWWQL